MFLGMVVLCVALIYYFGSQPGGDSTPVFAGSVGIAMLTQFITVFVCKVITHRKGLWWFWIGLTIFVLALTIWKLGHTGELFCSSRFIAHDFPWPHPVWHLMGAFAMFCFGMSFIYQKDPEPCYPRLHLEVLETPPAGPSLDEPEPAETGVRHNRYLTVRFQYGSTAIHANQPRSMR
jgi:drug/metabolite transporter (DMT)-like permease